MRTTTRRLDVATLRKFDYCFEKLRLKPGDHILEIGPGWGAWFEYASKRGVKCTGITISKVSIDYLTKRGKELGYDWELIDADLLAYQTERKYDAIVIMGVIEHLPHYEKVLDQVPHAAQAGRPGVPRRQRLHQEIRAVVVHGEIHLWRQPLVPGARTTSSTSSPGRRFEVLEICNDRMQLFPDLPAMGAELRSHKDLVIERFGEFDFAASGSICGARPTSS